MKGSEDVPVQQLVVDSGAFIRRAPLHDLALELYTTCGVINEMKCEKTRHFLDTLPYEIFIREPTCESLKIMTEVAKKTGDYPSLSAVDLKVLALVHDLHVEKYGKEGLNYDCLPGNNECWVQQQQDRNVLNIIKDVKASSGTEKVVECGSDVDDDASDGSGGSDGGTWLNEDNLDEVLEHVGEVAVPEKNMKIACLTTDFAMQNILLRLGLYLLSVDGYRIRRLNSYILRCWACFATTTVMTKRFCARCGNDSLHRVAVTVDQDGTVQLHINWRRLQSARGLKYSLPAPKGGKHAIGPQLFEDQRIPQNRMPRRHEDSLATGPFTLKDVTSRSAVLGLRSLQKTMGRNPNVRTRGRKRGNKRR